MLLPSKSRPPAGSRSHPGYAPKPARPQKRRHEPAGILLGTWRLSGLPASQANAVYGSRDKKNRINRRISKQSPSGAIFTAGGNYNSGKTPCRHEDIDYLEKYQVMSKEEVDAVIMSLLISLPS